jgi:predicted nucleic acid-binding protein
LTIYADSSFIVSNYLQDVHSAKAVHRMMQHPSVWVTPLNKTEVTHAIYRYVFTGRVSASEARRFWREFENDCSIGVWTQTSFPETAWETSTDLVRRYGATLGVRSLDSLHVASALDLRAKKFWTFDERQAKLAEAVGLNTSP